MAAFDLKKRINDGHLIIRNEDLINELMTLKYQFQNDGRRILVSKDKMRKDGVKSPNLADGLLMASSLIDETHLFQEVQYGGIQTESREENLFKIAGVR